MKDWETIYKQALKALPKSTTTEQAAYCVNLSLHAKLALESFSLEKKNFIAFHLLDDNVKRDFANTIENRISEFLKQVKTNSRRIKYWIPQVKFKLLPTRITFAYRFYLYKCE